MSNNFDPQQLYLQQLLAAQSQGGLGVPYATTSLMLDQHLLGSSGLHDRLAYQPTPFEIATGVVDPQQLNLLQTMMLMNSERAMNNEQLRNNEMVMGQERTINNQQPMMKQEPMMPQERMINQDRLMSQERMMSQEQFLGQDFSINQEGPAAKRKLLMAIEATAPGRSLQEDPREVAASIHAIQDNEFSPEHSIRKIDSKPKLKQLLIKAPSIKSQKKKQDTKWLASYGELKQYKAEHGDCIVPRGYPLNPRLASWVAEQRKQFKLMKDGKQSSITPRRIEFLNELDFAWNAQEAAWDRHMTDLKRFREQYGDCLVPLNHPKYPKLGLWVKEQRRHYTLMKQGKPSHMTEERARALDDVGFCWDTHEAVWGERLRELCQYKAVFGDCIVPTNYGENPKLGTWVHHQRRQYKKFKEGKPCHITAERIRALDSLGFVWYPRERSRPHDGGSASDTESDTDLANLDLRPNKRQRT